jgi:hypothetical protein
MTQSFALDIPTNSPQLLSHVIAFSSSYVVDVSRIRLLCIPSYCATMMTKAMTWGKLEKKS